MEWEAGERSNPWTRLVNGVIATNKQTVAPPKGAIELVTECRSQVTRARAQGLDAVIRLIVTQPRSIAESIAVWPLYPSEKQAIREVIAWPQVTRP